MPYFGNLGEFDSKQESWSDYSERLQQFFVANDVADENRRRAIFITVVGASTYALLKNLLSPAQPTDRTLAQLLEILSRHFEPPPSEIVERFKFNSRVRKTGESVSLFVAELRSLARYCNFGATLDVMLRDRVVCGINDDMIQKKLLSEQNLTLNRATEVAIATEAAVRNAADLKCDKAASSSVYHLKSKKSDFRPKNMSAVSSKAGSGACYCCGEKGHVSTTCKYKKCVCHACGKIGHLAKLCASKKYEPNKKGKSTSHVHQLVKEKEPPNGECPVFDLFSVCSQSQIEAPPAFRVDVKLNGTPSIMEVDTGAPFSVMPYSVYRAYQNVFPSLRESDIKLRSFTKQQLKIVGSIEVSVQYKSRKVKLPILVVDQCSVMLMGRDWIGKLNVLCDLDAGFSTNSIQKCLSPDTTLQSILASHKELFSSGLGCLKGVKIHLNEISSVAPKFYKARPVPYAYRQKVESEIDRLLNLGVLQPVSHSDWATPVVPVLKANGQIRLCGDFKLTANVATTLEQYPLPNVEDLFARLSGGISFSKIDLSDAYCQLEVDEPSKRFLVINTHRGLFQYTRLPFGVASAPAVFQREMDKLLQGHDKALCYLDDLLVTGSSTEEHLKNLGKVLSTLQAAGIKLHPSKCFFMQSSVEYLGHRIDKEGLHPVQSKVDAIEMAPAPTNVDELRSFLGLLTYYAKFLPNMSTMLSPLYQLLHKTQAWRWGKAEQHAFCTAKKKLTTSSLLVHFDEHQEVQLECDASPYGVGAVLSHPSKNGDRPIAFASRSLSKAEKNYSQIEREALSLIFGVMRYRKYLLGRTFTLVTDHQPLVSLLSEKKPVPPMAASRIQRWAVILSAYSYRIVYRKGTLHSNADACSRLPVEACTADLPRPADVVLLLEAIDDSPVTVHHFQRELASNPFLVQLMNYIHQGWPKSVPEEFHPFWLCRAELSVQEGVILRANRVFVPPQFRNYVLSELHAGHQGMCALKAMARQSVWWPNIDKDLENVVRSCTTCQSEAAEPASHLSPWPYIKTPWSRIHIDHAGPFENHIVLVVVDAATKWLEAVPVSSTCSAATIAALSEMFARFGLPKTIVSDNGTSFTSEEFSNFLQKNGIVHVRTAPYHPQSNGQAERAVRSLKEAMRKIKKGTFRERLNGFLFYYRMSPNSSTGLSPACSMFSREIRSRLALLQPEQRTASSGMSKFGVQEQVWCRNYGRGPKWIPGEVSSSVGNVMSKVSTSAGCVVRHRDQMCRRHEGGAGQVLEKEAPEMPLLDSAQESEKVARESNSDSPEEGPPLIPPDSPRTLRRSQRQRKPPEKLDL